MIILFTPLLRSSPPKFTPHPPPEATISRGTSCLGSQPCTRPQVSRQTQPQSLRGSEWQTDTDAFLCVVYSYIGKEHPQAWASTILAIVSIFVTTPIFVSPSCSDWKRS